MDFLELLYDFESKTQQYQVQDSPFQQLEPQYESYTQQLEPQYESYTQQLEPQYESYTQQLEPQYESEYFQQLELSQPHQVKQNKGCYICHVCEKGLKTKHSLKHHLKIHDKNRNKFSCNQCTKSFYLTDMLKKHIRTHVTHVGNCY